MEYFHALLDSYDKLKKRKLRVVLPSISEVTTKASTEELFAGRDAILSKIQNLSQPVTLAQLGGKAPEAAEVQFEPGVGQNNQPAIWMISQHFRPNKVNALTTLGRSEMTQNARTVIAYYLGEGEGGGAEGEEEDKGRELTPEEKEAQELAAQQELAEQQAAIAAEQEERRKLGWLDIEKDAASIIEKLPDTTTEKLRELAPGAIRDGNYFMSYVVGNANQSLERKIRNAKGLQISRAEDGTLVGIALPDVDESVKKTVTAKIKKAFNYLEKGTGCTEEARSFFNNNFQKTQIGKTPGLIVRGHLQRGDGLVVDNQTAGVLTSLIEGQCGEKNPIQLGTVKFDKQISGDDRTGDRGYSMEHVLEPLNYQAKCQQLTNKFHATCADPEEVEGYAQSKGCKNLANKMYTMCDTAREATSEFAARTGEYIEIHSWVRAFKEDQENFPHAISEELAEFLDRWDNTFEGENLKGVVRAMAIASQTSMYIRKPDLIGRVGSVTGDGEKDDNAELWLTKQGAIDGAMAQGYTKSEAQRMIAQENLEDVFVGQDTALERARKAYKGEFEKVKGKETVYRIGLSLKNLLKKQSEHAGERFDTVLSESINTWDSQAGDYKDSFRQTVQIRLGMDDLDIANIKDYQAKQDKITNLIDSIPEKAQFLGADGKIKTGQPFMDAVDSAIKELRTNSDVQSLLDPSDAVGELYDILKTYQDQSAEEGKAIPIERVKETMIRYYTNKRLQRDVFTDQEKRTQDVSVLGNTSEKQRKALEDRGYEKEDIDRIIENKERVPDPNWEANTATKYLATTAALVAASRKDIMTEVRILSGDINICNYMHNDVVYKVLNGLKDGSWNAEKAKGMGIRVVNPEKSEQSINVSKQGKGTNTRGTQSHVHMTSGLVEAHCRRPQKGVSESTAIGIGGLSEKLVEAQVELIKFIIQGNNNHSTQGKFQA